MLVARCAVDVLARLAACLELAMVSILGRGFRNEA
jgi:hypothetical protein